MGRHVAVFLPAALLSGGCGDETTDDETTSDGPTSSTAEPADEIGVVCADAATPTPILLEVGRLEELPDNGRGHVLCPDYARRPPASGAHFEVWQNCGFYTAPIQDQTAVHALEHGAVWIAFAPDLAADEVAAIEERVATDNHLLAAPYPGLMNPIVLTAWTRQLAVDRVADPLFGEFIGDHLARRSPTAPEAGASCEGAVGETPGDPDARFDVFLEQLRSG